jgi:hypothetical protein
MTAGSVCVGCILRCDAMRRVQLGEYETWTLIWGLIDSRGQSICRNRGVFGRFAARCWAAAVINTGQTRDIDITDAGQTASTRKKSTPWCARLPKTSSSWRLTRSSPPRRRRTSPRRSSPTARASRPFAGPGRYERPRRRPLSGP